MTKLQDLYDNQFENLSDVALSGDSADVSFAPTTPANWSIQPTDTKNALDLLAEREAQVALGLTTIPTGSTSSTTTVDSASTTFVDVMSTTVTLLQTTIIHGMAVMNLQAITSAAVAGMRVVIDTQNGQTVTIPLANTTDVMDAMVQHFSTSLNAGTYTVKVQIQRSSGTGTVRFIRGSLFAQGQQAAIAPNSPSRILYVSKNGTASPSGDGSWSRPFSTISAAVTAAQAIPSDFNAPIAICVSPGVGTTQYSETAPITITKGGLCIVSSSTQDFKGVQVHLSGSFVVNMTGSNLFFALIGFEINCPSGAAWNSQPAALYVTGSSSQRIFCGGMVLNSNAGTRHAIYCDNALATVTVHDSEIKAGASGTSNLAAINAAAGTLIISDCDTTNRQTGNVGQAISQAGSALTINNGTVSGSIARSTDTGILLLNGPILNSGINPAISCAATLGSGQVQIIEAKISSSAANVITGSEQAFLGVATFLSTGSGFDSALNGGTGISPLKTEIGYVMGTSANWPSSVKTVGSALDSLAATVVRRVAVPATSSDPGKVGDFAVDSNFAYFCIATNTWVRMSVSTF